MAFRLGFVFWVAIMFGWRLGLWVWALVWVWVRVRHLCEIGMAQRGSVHACGSSLERAIAYGGRHFDESGPHALRLGSRDRFAEGGIVAVAVRDVDSLGGGGGRGNVGIMAWCVVVGWFVVW